ncbi:AbrB/MazE/SpoVT family DNA-binding domain-containing protein [Lederbergia sp. NSJ-179]|nr:AbrB/MazE/SpoVT family DNA-binding domain-containing protein [Lederbergia sp. NSJ-179]MCJ7840652.1 AbrB/MazE/SpoVT family DNA-binding domain-containing protein [Lederbergia sp. NSJ-179]
MVMMYSKERKRMTDISGKRLRRVKVSKQRQISIPKEFYDALNIDDEATVEFTGKELIIRPLIAEEEDFSEDILRDLVRQGYTGDELIQKFSKMKRNIPKALDYMKKETQKQPMVSESLDEYLESLEDTPEDE